MGDILEMLQRFFEEDGWPVTRLEEEPILRSGFHGENGQWPLYAQVREEHHQVAFYSIWPTNVAEGKRVAVAEFMTRANYGLIIGNFELDFADGEVRYKTSLPVVNNQLSPDIVHHLVYANVLTMDRYLPGILGVVYGALAPAEAVAQVEGYNRTNQG